MATCFVIQPFDGGAFDKRYEDVFVPAIKSTGLEPYRVDRDPSVMIPIDEIERGIHNAEACLADISTPNPNVWFELGYAIAAGKPVILVCAFESNKRFPFDIQHRTVITYRTESARDFEELKGHITIRLQAALSKDNRLERLAEASVVADIAGLNQMEMVALVSVAENADGPEDSVSTWSIRNDMERSGYRQLAVRLALTTLLRKGMIEASRDCDQNGNDFTVYRVTDCGIEWLLENQDLLVLKQQKVSSPELLESDEVPF